MADDRSAEVSFGSVTAARMARQLLTDPRPDSDPQAVVAVMCGTHAQVMSAAELSIAVRSAAVTSAAIRSAIGDRHTLVKTLGPRGTVHLLPAAELPHWLAGLASIGCLAPGFPPDVRLDAGQQAAVVDAIGAALTDAELTVDELSEEVGQRVGAWAIEPVMPAFQAFWPRWRQAMAAAAHAGGLCFGPLRGRAVTYTSPARWVAGLGAVYPAEGERWLARTYLAAYGPSTPEWFAKWLNAPVPAARRAFDRLAGDVVHVTVDGMPCLDLADRAEPELGNAGPAGIRLLPYFDQFVVSGRPRESLFPARAAVRALVPSGQAGNFPVLLVDGVVGGVWHLRRTGRRAVVTVEPLDRLTARQRSAVGVEVDRIAAFLGVPADLVFGAISVGPHA